MSAICPSGHRPKGSPIGTRCGAPLTRDSRGTMRVCQERVIVEPEVVRCAWCKRGIYVGTDVIACSFCGAQEPSSVTSGAEYQEPEKVVTKEQVRVGGKRRSRASYMREYRAGRA